MEIAENSASNNSVPKFNGTDFDARGSDESWPTVVVVVQTITICVFAFLTVAGNSLIILSIAKFHDLQTMTSAFILNLAIADFLIGVTLMPVALVTCTQQSWLLGTTFCKVSGAVNMLLPSASILTLSVVAIDRYCAIIRPLKYYSIMTKRTVVIFLVWLWCQSLLISVLPLSTWASFRYIRSEFLCLVDWRSSQLSFAIFSVVFYITVPMGIMSYCYYHILKVARHHSRRVNALNTLSTKFSTENQTSDGSNRSQSHRCTQNIKTTHNVRITSRENKSTAMMIMVMGTFIVSWLPYIVGSMCQVINSNCGIPDSYFTVSVLVAMLQSSLNPIIYGAMDLRFRVAMKAIVFCSSRPGDDVAIAIERQPTSTGHPTLPSMTNL